MERFEKTAIKSSEIIVDVYKRYADDIFTKTASTEVQTLLEAMNAEHKNISMTHEMEQDGKLGYLDVMVIRGKDNQLQTTVYRKPCHSNQYLHFDSNHPMQHKISVVRTLIARAYTHCSTEALLQE